jgi:hypothetical protein
MKMCGGMWGDLRKTNAKSCDYKIEFSFCCFNGSLYLLDRESHFSLRGYKVVFRLHLEEKGRKEVY